MPKRPQVGENGMSDMGRIAEGPLWSGEATQAPLRPQPTPAKSARGTPHGECSHMAGTVAEDVGRAIADKRLGIGVIARIERP